MKKIIMIIITAISVFNEASAMDNVGIYLLQKGILSVEVISNLAKGASVELTSTEKGKSFHVSWPDVSIIILMRNGWHDRAVQVNGMTNWINSFGSKEKSVKVLLNKVDAAVDLLGCVIEPAYDNEGKISNLVKHIAKEYNGFIFSHQSFYDENGKKIIGDPDDPNSI
jgi:hypothetical protein